MRGQVTILARIDVCWLVDKGNAGQEQWEDDVDSVGNGTVRI